MRRIAPAIEIEPDLAEIVVLTALAARRIGPAPDGGAALARAIDATVGGIREHEAALPPARVPRLEAARRLYRRLGIDPTRIRPSPEAIWRRVRRGEPFPRRDAVVDLANLWAVRTGLPVGLYDLDALSGPIRLRRGRPGEAYAGIGKPVVRLESRPVLCDARGPFGNPTSDAARTAIGAGSRRALFVQFAPRDLSPGDRDRARAWLIEHLPLAGWERHPEPPAG